MHLSDKKSENVKLEAEGARQLPESRLAASCPGEQATPGPGSWVEVSRSAVSEGELGPREVWFQDLTSTAGQDGGGEVVPMPCLARCPSVLGPRVQHLEAVSSLPPSGDTALEGPRLLARAGPGALGEGRG